MKKLFCLILVSLIIFTVSCRKSTSFSENIESTENASHNPSQLGNTELSKYVDDYEYVCNICPFEKIFKTYES